MPPSLQLPTARAAEVNLATFLVGMGVAMAPVDAGWRALEPLQARSDEFLAFVEGYLPQVQALTDDQQRTLALFKSAELVNALLKIRERRQSEDRFGTELAHASFDVVRRAIRNRRLVLVDGEVVDLHAPPIRALIDEGCRLFHAGKGDSAVYQQALALSAAQCIVLHPHLDQALLHYARGCGLSFPEALLQAVRDDFIRPYAQGRRPSHSRANNP